MLFFDHRTDLDARVLPEDLLWSISQVRSVLTRHEHGDFRNDDDAAVCETVHDLLVANLAVEWSLAAFQASWVLSWAGDDTEPPFTVTFTCNPYSADFEWLIWLTDSTTGADHIAVGTLISTVVKLVRMLGVDRAVAARLFKEAIVNPTEFSHIVDTLMAEKA